MDSEKEFEQQELDNPDFDDIYSDDSEEDGPSGRSFLFRLTALFTVLAFIGLVAITSLPGLNVPIFELVSESLHHKKDIDEQLLQAVVKINVVSRKKGSSLAVEQKSGTGFNISPGGLIVTNHHVVDDALNIAVSFPDGKMYSAARWTGKPEYDLALITLNKANLPTVPLNTSSPPVSGDHVRIVGNPLGLNNIIVAGEVKQYLTMKDQKVFSIDAQIYPGNSGSPVYDKSGKVVGVVFGSLRKGDDSNVNLGLAVPIADILRLKNNY
ncbi:MAG: S1C family serine protease [Bacillota bacterium]